MTVHRFAISKLSNVVRNYEWGSRTGIPNLLGTPSPSSEPQAELWMGAHRSSPSQIEVAGNWQSLAELIEEAPLDILGQRVVQRFGPELPFLFKVLAADQALSIQAHPDRDQAKAGWQREEAQGLPRDAARRNYRDSNHKPELLFAVTPFEVLRGFRPASEAYDLMRRVGLSSVMPEAVAALQSGDLETYFRSYLSNNGDVRGSLSPVLEVAESLAVEEPAYRWLVELDRQFPGDLGILAPLFLRVESLQPGEAIFTGPGILHAYLRGVGIELMANSDNVVRGGLTAKYVDGEELCRILRFESAPGGAARAVPIPGGQRLTTSAEEFELEVLVGGTTLERQIDAVEIFLCTEGQGSIPVPGETSSFEFCRGESFLVPASVGRYRIEGDFRLFRAGLPSR